MNNWYYSIRDGYKVKIEQLREKGRRLKKELVALYFAYRMPGVPFYAKIIAALVVAYALSPIDLIPDFIPVIGYLDDLIIIPFGITLAIKLIPEDIMEECRVKAEKLIEESVPKNWLAGIVIVCFWTALILFILIKIFSVKK